MFLQKALQIVGNWIRTIFPTGRWQVLSDDSYELFFYSTIQKFIVSKRN